MKIAFIGGRNIHKLGGIEAYMYNLCTELASLGHEPIVFCESEFDGEEELRGFKVIHQKGPQSPLLCKPILGLKSTLRVIKKYKDVEVIHYNAWPPSLWNPIARICGIKTVMQGHGLEWQRTKYSRVQSAIMKFMEMFTAYWNPNLIMCSNAQVEYFKKHYHRKSTTIPTAINLPDTDNSDDAKFLQKHNLSPKGYFLFMARLVKDKNPDTLIKAFKEANIENKKLVIAGDNEADVGYVNFLHDLAKGNENIVFTGAVYGQEKNALLRNAFAFCLVSSIEGLSISLLEAMSYSLPLIVSDIEANREVLDNENSFWSTAEDVQSLSRSLLMAVNTNDRQLSAIGRANYNKVIPEYTWSQIAKKYIAYLETLK